MNKKENNIIFRIDNQLKEDFKKACNSNRKTMSRVIKNFIQTYVKNSKYTERR